MASHRDPLVNDTTLRAFNALVPLYLWCILTFLLLLASLFNAFSLYSAHQRRKYAARWAGGRFCPPDSCPRLGKRCSKWVPMTMLAVARKAGVRKPWIASRLGMGNAAQVAVIFVYLSVNLALVFGGGPLRFLCNDIGELMCI